VCDQVSGSPDYVRLSIHLDDWTQRPTCDGDLGAIECFDDENAQFFVDGKGMKTCAWLSKRVENRKWKNSLCNKDHPAYDICQETCGSCPALCGDTQGDLFVNKKKGFRDCEWLPNRSGAQSRLCVEGNDAYDLCLKSCGNCK
jgi:hypothetical protein